MSPNLPARREPKDGLPRRWDPKLGWLPVLYGEDEPRIWRILTDTSTVAPGVFTVLQGTVEASEVQLRASLVAWDITVDARRGDVRVWGESLRAIERMPSYVALGPGPR